MSEKEGTRAPRILPESTQESPAAGAAERVGAGIDDQHERKGRPRCHQAARILLRDERRAKGRPPWPAPPETEISALAATLSDDEVEAILSDEARRRAESDKRAQRVRTAEAVRHEVRRP